MFNKKFYYVEQDCWISLSLCAAGLRIINKKGLDAALNDVLPKGIVIGKPLKLLAKTLKRGETDYGKESKR